MVARDARVFLIEDVGTLVDLVLNRSVPERQAEGLVDAGDVDVLERDAWARVDLRTVERGNYVVSRSSREIDPVDVLYGHLGGVTANAAVASIDALADLDGKADILKHEVTESDVLNNAATTATAVAVSSCVKHVTLPGLYIGTVCRVETADILEGHVIDIVRRLRVLAN